MTKLLVPLVGSERSMQAVTWIREHYSPTDTSVTLLLVREDWEDIWSEELYHYAKEEALPLLNQGKDSLPAFTVSTEVRFGHAGEQILDYAQEHQVDTIVMTKSTKPGFMRLVGSVTSYVVRNTPCVVVVLP